jgi:excisionase family DNA binding protein
VSQTQRDKLGREAVSYMKPDVPLWEKYSLNVEEAANYYGIGVKKLYEIIHNNPNGEFLLEVGTHYRLKRVLFEKFLDDATTL